MEKVNLLIENIPYYKFQDETIYDEIIESVNRGMITYITDGTDDEIFIKCNVNDYKNNKDKEYLFLFSTHMLRWDVLCRILISNHDVGVFFRDLLSAKNVKCVFVDIHESDDLQDLKKLNRILNKFNFDKSKLWILNNDSELENFVFTNNLSLQVKKTNYLATFNHDIFYDDYDSIKKTNTDKFFLCVNKRPKIHRIATLAYLKKYDLIKDVNYSILENTDNEDTDFLRFLGNEESTLLENDLEYILSKKPKQTDYESIHNVDLLNTKKYTYAGIIDLDDYGHSLVNIVTESMFETDSVHITEKSFKPFSFCQLPIFVATTHHVKYLKSHYNLDLYDDIIDHSYDNEINNRKRLKMVINEIRRLYLIKDEIIDFFNKNKERVLNNRILIDEIQMKKLDYNFFKKNILCV